MHNKKILSVLILGCCLLAPAYAQQSDLGRTGELEFKDMDAGTLTIDGRVYLVTARTRLRDHEGHSVTLAAIDSPQTREEDVDELLDVFYTAAEAGGELRLLTLEIMGLPPE